MSLKIQRHSLNILSGILKATAAKKDDSEEDTDADLEEEKDIRKYRSYFHGENFFLIISMVERKHEHLLNIFFLLFIFVVIYCFFTQNSELCRDLSLRNMEWNKKKRNVKVYVQSKAYYINRPCQRTAGKKPNINSI